MFDIGTYVQGHRHLTDAGIQHDAFEGVVIKNENGIITVANSDTQWITGLDSILPAQRPNENLGRRVRCTGTRIGVPNEAVGEEGTVVGMHTAEWPYVIFDNVRGYGGRHSGSWVVREFEYVDTPSARAVQVGDRVQAFEPNIPLNDGPWIGTLRRIRLDHPNAKYWVETENHQSGIWFNRVEPFPVQQEEPITFATRDRLIGRRIRVISANSGVQRGQEYTVTGTYHRQETSSLDRITANVGPNGDEDDYWVQEFELLPLDAPTEGLKVGDKIITTAVPGVPDAVGRVATITRLEPSGTYTVTMDDTGYDYVGVEGRPLAEEGPITFETKERMIGKRIRVVYADGQPEHVGVEGVVTEVFHAREHSLLRWPNKVDGITVRIAETGIYWVQDYIVLDDEPPAEETPALMEVGQRVRYTSGDFEGRYGTITRVDASDDTLPYYVEVDGGAGRGWTNRVEAADAPAPDGETEQLRAENRRLTERIRRMERDWEINDAAIKEEAVRRAWCGDYERVTGGINRNMSEFSYTPRVVEREYVLEVEVEGTMRTTTTVTVTAESEEHAWELFNEDPHHYLDADDALTRASRSDSFTDIEINPA